jgi:hypothetical protein
MNECTFVPTSNPPHLHAPHSTLVLTAHMHYVMQDTLLCKLSFNLSPELNLNPNPNPELNLNPNPNPELNLNPNPNPELNLYPNPELNPNPNPNLEL